MSASLHLPYAEIGWIKDRTRVLSPNKSLQRSGAEKAAYRR
jgi:hypothetical protein